MRYIIARTLEVQAPERIAARLARLDHAFVGDRLGLGLCNHGFPGAGSAATDVAADGLEMSRYFALSSVTAPGVPNCSLFPLGTAFRQGPFIRLLGSLECRADGYRKTSVAAALPWSQALPRHAASAASALVRPTAVMDRRPKCRIPPWLNLNAPTTPIRRSEPRVLLWKPRDTEG